MIVLIETLYDAYFATVFAYNDIKVTIFVFMLAKLFIIKDLETSKEVLFSD